MRFRRLYILTVCLALFVFASALRAEETFHIQATDKPVGEFLKEISSITGKNFVLDPSVKGSVTFVSPNALTKDQVWEVAKSALSINGFTTVEYGAIVKVVPKEAAAHQPLPTLGTTQTPEIAEDMVTAVISLKYISPEQAIESVRVLLGPNGKIAASPGNPGIVIIDSEANIARIRKLISRFDVQSAQPQVKIVHLKRINADEAAQILTELFLKTGGVKGVGVPCRFTSEARTNSLVIRAPFIDGKAAENLAMKLDKKDAEITVQKLRNMDAEAARELLNSLAD